MKKTIEIKHIPRKLALDENPQLTLEALYTIEKRIELKIVDSFDLECLDFWASCRGGNKMIIEKINKLFLRDYEEFIWLKNSNRLPNIHYEPQIIGTAKGIISYLQHLILH